MVHVYVVFFMLISASLTYMYMYNSSTTELMVCYACGTCTSPFKLVDVT